VAAAKGLLGLNWESIHTIMERAVQRGVDRRSWEGVEMVGMDKKSFQFSPSPLPVTALKFLKYQ
jgi:hypothetical protein